MKQALFSIVLGVTGMASQGACQVPAGWKHLSSATGELPAPNKGTEQTSITIGDFAHDGHPGFGSPRVDIFMNLGAKGIGQ